MTAEEAVDEDEENTLVAASDDACDGLALEVPGKLPPTFIIPREISESDDPARGLLAISLSLRRLINDADPVSLLVHIFEARCILPGQVRHDAWFGVGKFYIKAILSSAGKVYRDQKWVNCL